MLFQGELFETDPAWIRLKNLLVDLFGGRPTKSIDVKGLDHALVFTSYMNSTMSMTIYELNEGVPKLTDFSTTLKLRRQNNADSSVFGLACRIPKKASQKKKKNVTTNAMKETRGQIHVKQQDIKTLALKKRKRAKSADDKEKE